MAHCRRPLILASLVAVAEGRSSTPTPRTRGLDMFNTAYHYLGLLPNGRNEDGHAQYWVRRHDEHDA